MHDLLLKNKETVTLNYMPMAMKSMSDSTRSGGQIFLMYCHTLHIKPSFPPSHLSLVLICRDKANLWLELAL